MKIRQWLINWLARAEETNLVTQESMVISRTSRQLENENAFRFTIFPAAGGKVVQVEHYERRKDQHYTKLYVVGPDDKLGDEIEQIYALEQLSH